MRYDPKGRKQTDLARDHEIAQLRSVVGSLVQVARQCRPQLSYGVNKLQSLCGTVTLDEFRFANKLLQEAKNSSDEGLFYLAQNGDVYRHRRQLWKRVELFAVKKGG